MNSESGYFRARAFEERERAAAASELNVANIHLELAVQQCAKRVSSRHETLEIERPLSFFPTKKRTYCCRPQYQPLESPLPADVNRFPRERNLEGAVPIQR
jgi:hypothetical protein